VGAVGGADGEAVVLQFEPAAGFEVAVDMLVGDVAGDVQGVRLLTRKPGGRSWASSRNSLTST
jgi:hypothetical protein